MTLYEEWQDLINNQTDESFDEFWDEYSTAEIKLYKELLQNGEKAIKGTIKAISEKHEIRSVFVMAFLDGISESLKKELVTKELSEDSEVSLKVDFEKLYFNMHKAEANHLYSLEAWDKVLSVEKRAEIEKAYKKSKTVVKEKTPGRNDSCPCGSGKKYKKCCGKGN